MVCEARSDNNPAPFEIDLAHAGLDEGQQEAGIQLDHVVRDPRRHIGDSPKRPAFLDDFEPGEVGDVVGVSAGRRELGAGDLERRAPLDGMVEADDESPSRPLRLDNAGRLAAGEQLRPDLEPLWRFTRLLDDERSGEPVRASHTTNRDSLSAH